MIKSKAFRMNTLYTDSQTMPPTRAAIFLNSLTSVEN
ncbi:hypothetical protein G163CM_36740 [Pseudocitrobacter corydidari]|uniref:Uncharacterized protein n=1 Tax=Pseudocitrobacter corydidari TaxID=2891570 RepID=A0ABY3SBA2_9ENTR|nr:hypothetical protein D782_0068 [Enterobacteriaceae bacterium strain FGI 57]UGS42910.1 hypothetical protein G163CM_36740 [Pseudocitrobacter corydidari]